MWMVTIAFIAMATAIKCCKRSTLAFSFFLSFFRFFFFFLFFFLTSFFSRYPYKRNNRIIPEHCFCISHILTLYNYNHHRIIIRHCCKLSRFQRRKLHHNSSIYLLQSECVPRSLSYVRLPCLRSPL